MHSAWPQALVEYILIHRTISSLPWKLLRAHACSGRNLGNCHKLKVTQTLHEHPPSPSSWSPEARPAAVGREVLMHRSRSWRGLLNSVTWRWCVCSGACSASDTCLWCACSGACSNLTCQCHLVLVCWSALTSLIVLLSAGIGVFVSGVSHDVALVFSSAGSAMTSLYQLALVCSVSAGPALTSLTVS